VPLLFYLVTTVLVLLLTGDPFKNLDGFIEHIINLVGITV